MCVNQSINLLMMALAIVYEMMRVEMVGVWPFLIITCGCGLIVYINNNNNRKIVGHKIN